MNVSDLLNAILHSLSTTGHWEVFAFVGCAAVETCYVPQLARLYALKDAEEISLIFPMLNVFGRTITLLCLAHAGQNIFAFWIAIGLILRLSFLAQVIYYRLRRRLMERLQRETVAI